MILMSREQIRRYDSVAGRRYGIPGVVLMENAGRGAAELVRRLVERIPRRRGSDSPRVGIVCGPGNNGGDGFVIARHLANAGVRVRIYLMASPARLRGDAAVNFAIARRTGLDIEECPEPRPVGRIVPSLRHDAIVVDALFGTGLDREVAGRSARIIDAINAAPGLKVAVDIPSGLDCDTGRPLGTCVRADHTVTFAALKVGLALHPGVDLAGAVHVASIGAPARLAGEIGGVATLLTGTDVAKMLPARPRSAHKGTFGHLLLVAGTPGKSGAAVLAAEAAVRCGAGLVTIATTEDARQTVESRVREAMVETLLPNATAPLTAEAERRWRSLLKGRTAVAIGPGCGTGAGMRALVRKIIRESDVPVVVDADGLNAIAGEASLLRRARSPVVVTPHPGEMSRLTGLGIAEIQSDRIGIARRFAARTRTVVTLKGARTIVAAPDGRVFVNPTGNPGLASGGSGDTLTGMIGAFVAQGTSAIDAACAGVFVHGASADCAAEGHAEGRGLAARDVVAELPFVLRAVGKTERS